MSRLERPRTPDLHLRADHPQRGGREGSRAKRASEVIDSLEELKAARDCVVVIRSHGVGKDVYRILEENGAEIVDATCPYVKKIHRIVEEQSKAGRQVLIVGDAAHPEVQGIRGWGDSGTKVIENERGFPRFAASGGQQALHRGPDDI